MAEPEKKQFSVFIDSNIIDEFTGICERACLNKSARIQFLMEQDLPTLREAEKKLSK